MSAEGEKMLVEMEVSCIVADPFTNRPIVILNDSSGEKTLPIWVGIAEASSIAMEIENTPRQRPITHDLMKNVMEAVGCEMLRIEITELRESTFYAAIHIRKNGKDLVVDSRPSDAIAMALRARCRILVDESVIRDALSMEVGEEKQTMREVLENMPDEGFGKYKM